jgi:hypothetical protein
MEDSKLRRRHHIRPIRRLPIAVVNPDLLHNECQDSTAHLELSNNLNPLALRDINSCSNRRPPMDTFTLIHVAISLVAIVAGFVVIFALIAAKRPDRWTDIFLITTAATSITGFFFPFVHITPGIILGILSLLVLVVIAPALYVFQLAGGWRAIFVIGSTIALYFNVFVLIVQSFQKVPTLHSLAPTQTEPPFAVAQGAALVLFIVLGTLATKRFHVEAISPAVVARSAAKWDSAGAPRSRS